MKTRRIGLLVSIVAVLALGGCEGEKPGEGCNADGNPLDAVLCEEFDAMGYEPIRAADEELCTRLFVDMLGVRPAKDEVASRCAGRTPAQIVRSFQATPEYRETQRRRWADRFRYSDFMVDVGAIKELDGLVDRLYRQQISYSDFAVISLSHPAFVGRFTGYGQPELVAEAAFRAFLGRQATTPEAWDLGNLWRPWSGGYVVEGNPPPEAFVGEEAGPYYGYGTVPYVDPFICEAGVQSCASTLLGDASIEFPRNGRDQFLSPDLLTAEDWVALRAPGRLFVSLPMFWEAQVDDVLQRYLGYDLGAIRPEARQSLVRWFRANHGNVVRLERVVLTSWAYTQSAVTDPLERRPSALRNVAVAYGPTKLMIPESWLRSVGVLTGTDVGNCDWRYPNLPEWFYPGDPELEEKLADIYPRREDGTIDPWFRNAAAAMGGCPGTFDYLTYSARERSTQMGLMASVAQEEAVVELCFLSDAPGLLPEGVEAGDTGRSDIRKVIRHLLDATTGRTPDDREVEAILSAAERGCAHCSAEAVARDLCAGLSGGVEFIFY